MSVLDRSTLEQSPLADLYSLADSLAIDGFRRLRRDDLIGAILERQGGADEDRPGVEATLERRGERERPEPDDDAEHDGPPSGDDAVPRRRRARGKSASGPDEDSDSERPPARTRRRRPRRATGATAEGTGESEDAPESEQEPQTVEGTVELLANGSGFLRVSPPDPNDDDVYISAAQARRCELVSGDSVTGPVRAPRRSERHPSLVRVDKINGVPVAEAVRDTKFDELDCDFPSEVLALGDQDPTLRAIGLLAPIGRGSRVSVAGPPRSGKSEVVKRLAAKLAEIEGLTLEVLLVGVRPEELSEWRASAIATVSGLTFAAGQAAQSGAVEQAVERGRRIAARGGDAVLLIDTLAGVEQQAARRALAAARNVRDGGSLTVIATGPAPAGGETTVIGLGLAAGAGDSFPAVDPSTSGTLRAELLVGDEGVEAGHRARAQSAR